MSPYSRVFLVDDNEMDNLFHEVILRRVGFAGEILIFELAQQALDYLQADETRTPLLIFLDINMPRMDGFQFAVKVEALLRQIPSATVVMLSSSSAELDKNKAAQIKAISGYIVKPLDETMARELLKGNLDPVQFRSGVGGVAVANAPAGAKKH